MFDNHTYMIVNYEIKSNNQENCSKSDTIIYNQYFQYENN